MLQAFVVLLFFLFADVERHIATVTVPPAMYSDLGRYWSTRTEDFSADGFYHPPCVEITAYNATNNNFHFVVRGKVYNFTTAGNFSIQFEYWVNMHF